MTIHSHFTTKVPAVCKHRARNPCSIAVNTANIHCRAGTTDRGDQGRAESLKSSTLTSMAYPEDTATLRHPANTLIPQQPTSITSNLLSTMLHRHKLRTRGHPPDPSIIIWSLGGQLDDPEWDKWHTNLTRGFVILLTALQ